MNDPGNICMKLLLDAAVVRLIIGSQPAMKTINNTDGYTKHQRDCALACSHA
ncbi:Uncharacterized protein APZ42_028377 [Daphnia magna]|uniref:Uncharacterized protein n=1 Tax=Daphnia magna TaxID=35525 RepID=A0A164QR59_9CRUS|nr:Uncharacterized protein APZ42_028377 [Daphnia magna]